MINQRLFSFIKHLFFLILAELFFPFLSFGQSNKTYVINDQSYHLSDEIDTAKVTEPIFEEILFDQFNLMLERKEFETVSLNGLFNKSAAEQAQYMAENDEATLEQHKKEKATTGKRIQFFGGTSFGEELVGKSNLSKGPIPFTFAKVSEDLLFRWFTNSKTLALFENNTFTDAGISVRYDKAKKRIFVSIVLGDYKSFNNGAGLIARLPLPYSEKQFGLKQPQDRTSCKKVENDNSLDDLQKGIEVEGTEIFLNTNNIKNLTKVIRNKKDGLAVDILQNEQFACGTPNIVNHQFVNAGILTKPVYRKKLFKKNQADVKENPKAFRTHLGTLPEGISDNYELNLVIIQNKQVCRTMFPSFTETPSGTYHRKVELLVDTIDLNTHFHYKPVADSIQRTFIIPFENNKYTYKAEDIEPFLKVLNEPAFIIYELTITAYSSVEGDDNENKLLQQKRAQSIVSAIESRQNQQIKTKIVTDYNWNDFVNDIKETDYHSLGSMNLEEARSYIRTFKLKDKLEPILAKHRYARIDIKAIHDISGNHEIPFVVHQFNQAIDSTNRPLALSIEKYIFKQITKGNYPPEILNELEIPLEKEFAGMQMNKDWLSFKKGQLSDSQFKQDISSLYELDPTNEYIAFNQVYLQVNDTLPDIRNTGVIQNQIDRLYYTHLKKETVDGINLRFQFKLINASDSIYHDAKLKEQCIERIKSIIDIRDESMGNSLRLAELFIEEQDYSFALKTLKPWVILPLANEELIFTFLSLCSHFEKEMHTQRFTYAMQRAHELNPGRYCELFNGSRLSLRVFENEKVKTDYCRYCNSRNPSR